MLANIGFESDQQQQHPRARGRRHAPHGENLNHPPTYMTAPFAVQQEPSRNTPSSQQQQQKQKQQQQQYEQQQQQQHGQQYSSILDHNDNGMMMHVNNYEPYPTRSDERQYQFDQQEQQNGQHYSGIINHNDNGMMMHAKNYNPYPSQSDERQYQYDQQHYEQAQPQQQMSHPSLRQDRLSRGGLNIFSWNTDVPVAPAPRMTHARDENELMRLRPTDASAQRDREVREKFETNTQSRFLCFSENAPRVAGAAVPHGRRRSAPISDGGIAGFAGMGLGNGDRIGKRE